MYQNGLMRHDNLDITPCLQPKSSTVLNQNVTQKLRNGGYMVARYIEPISLNYVLSWIEIEAAPKLEE